MKKLEFTTGKGRFVVVDTVDRDNYYEVLRAIIPDAEFIGIVKGLSEEKASEIVDSWINTSGQEVLMNYTAERIKGDLLGNISFITALDSLHSLIKSKGWYLSSNEVISKCPDWREYASTLQYQQDLEAWNKAESRTLHNPVIFKIASDKV